MVRRQFILLFLAIWPWASAQAGDAAKSIYQGPLERRIDAIASIQPGLGTVMREIAYRFSNAYWAANGGNWGLAQYQLTSLREAEAAVELTRPQHAQMLAAFERSYSEPLAGSIANKDLEQFNRRFSSAIDGCNSCHEKTGYGFLRYQVPAAGESGAFLDFAAKSEPNAGKPKP